MHTLRTAQEIHRKRAQIEAECDGGEIQRFEGQQIRPLVESVTRLAPDEHQTRWTAMATMGRNIDNDGEGICSYLIAEPGIANIYRRRLEVKGPTIIFGYDYLAEHAKIAGVAIPKLLSYEGLWGSGEEYAYEILNFADGRRSALEIRNAVSAEYGPVPLELVVEYLKALERIGLVEQVK